MPSARPWLLVFDLDGTLIDSSLDLCLAVNAALDHVGVAPRPHPVITSFIGDGAASLVRRALGQTPETELLDETSLQKQQFARAFGFFLDFYREHKLDNTRLHDGVFAALTAIQAEGDLPMAVLTNKPVRPSQEICEALGIAPFFFAIYGGNSLPSKKPDPSGLIQLAREGATIWRERGSVQPNHTADGVLMIGDSATDVLTARRAGARSLGCRYGLAPESLVACPPDLSCDTAEEWPALLWSLP